MNAAESKARSNFAKPGRAAVSVGSIGKSREIFGQPRNQRVEVEMDEEGTRMSGCFQLKNRKEPSSAPQVINS